jgi:hypothetical protein
VGSNRRSDRSFWRQTSRLPSEHRVLKTRRDVERVTVQADADTEDVLVWGKFRSFFGTPSLLGARVAISWPASRRSHWPLKGPSKEIPPCTLSPEETPSVFLCWSQPFHWPARYQPWPPNCPWRSKATIRSPTSPTGSPRAGYRNLNMHGMTTATCLRARHTAILSRQIPCTTLRSSAIIARWRWR